MNKTARILSWHVILALILALFPYFQLEANADDGTGFARSDIVIESVRIFNSFGHELATVTDETTAFSLEITFSDFGLLEIDPEDIRAERQSFEAYHTNPVTSGFKMPANRGTLRQIATTSRNDAPRFTVRFDNVTYTGNGKSPASLDFRVHYGSIQGILAVGNATASFRQTFIDDEDKKDDLTMPTPHIVITHFSYGGDAIVAGDEFTLDITYQNTSSVTALENILMKITTPKDILITSASNTLFVENLAAGASLTHSISLQARSNAEATSHGIDIGFDFEYIEDTKRTSGQSSETIAIPITQIDRFAVDPITEMSEWATAGDLFFVTVSFVNEGKSPVYNIAARIRGLNMELIAPVMRFDGQLGASVSGELDLEATTFEAGALAAEIVITYEDESMNQKEITIPFTLDIQEPYVPGQDMWPGGEWHDGMEQGGSGVGKQTVVLSIIGGVLFAAAFAMYIARRIVMKEREEIDEDF